MLSLHTFLRHYPLYGDVMVNINKRFGEYYNLTANIGTSIKDQVFEAAGGAGNLLLVNFFAMNNINYANKYKTIQEGWHDQTQSIFGSVELGYRTCFTSPLLDVMTGHHNWPIPTNHRSSIHLSAYRLSFRT